MDSIESFFFGGSFFFPVCGYPQYKAAPCFPDAHPARYAAGMIQF